MLGIALILFGLGICGFSILFAVSKGKLLPQNNENAQNLLENPKNDKFKIGDEMIIRLAHHLGGRLCVEDLIKQTQLSSAQAKDCLEGLAQKGICEIRLNEVQNSGKIYYYFD